MRKRQRITDALRASDTGGGSFKDLTFLPSATSQVVFASKDAAIIFGVLPAIAVDEDGEYDKGSYLPFRLEDDSFSEWMWLFPQWRGVGGTHNIISPKFFFGPEETDPVELLWKTAWDGTDYWHLIGKDLETKKIKKDDDAWKDHLLRRSDLRIGMNVVVPERRDLVNKFLVCSRQAIFPYQYEELSAKSGTKKKKDSGVWGLAESLDTLVKGHTELEQDDFEGRFYHGDITDPRNMALCEVSLCRPPQGGQSVYNAYVLEDEARFKISKSNLANRLTPEEVFVSMTAIETAKVAAEALLPHGEDAKDLMIEAWGNEGLEYEALISKLFGASSSASKASPRSAMGSRDRKSKPEKRSIQEEEDDDIPMTGKSRASSHKDDDDDLPPAAASKSNRKKDIDDDEPPAKGAAKAKSGLDKEDDLIDDDLPPVKSKASKDDDDDLPPAKPTKAKKEEPPLSPVDEEDAPPFDEDEAPKKAEKQASKAAVDSSARSNSGSRTKISAMLDDED